MMAQGKGCERNGDNKDIVPEGSNEVISFCYGCFIISCWFNL